MLAATTQEALLDAHIVLSYFKLELKQMGIGKLDLTDVKETLGFHGVQYKEGVLYIKCEDSGK